ncbi:MAG: AsmA-like C-terminal domain-containing protein [Alphaproteobacteria bacterium]|nr:AsmA-like C-terminal domain-containing protein [Alphaproteobacteria bacterium]
MTAPDSTPPLAPAPKRKARRATVLGWLGHLAASLSVLVVGALGALGIGLALGPVSLGPLGPLLIRAVSDTVAGYRLSASDALLIWSSAETRLVVRFVDPRLVDDNGVEIAAANDIAVAFSIDALLAGDIAPRSLTIVGPTATFMRLADGTYDVGIRTEVRRARQVQATEADATPFIEELLKPPVAGQEETYLSEITLSDATMTFIDEATDSIVKAPRGTLVVRRTADGLSASLDGQVSLPKGNWRFYGSATYVRGAPDILVDAGIVDANLDSLADAGPLFEEFQGAALPMSGTFKLVVGVGGTLKAGEGTVSAGAGLLQIRALSNIPFQVRSALVTAAYDRAKDLFELRRLMIDADSVSGEVAGSFRLRRGADGFLTGWRAELGIADGRLAIPDLFDGETPVDRLAMAADNDLVADILTLEELNLTSGPSRISVHGQVAGLIAGAPSIRMDGTISELPVMRLGTLWPKGVATGARDWIMENVHGGMITGGTLMADLTARQLEDGDVPDSAARFELNFTGVDMAYIDGLPHLTDVKGSAVVLGNRFRSSIESGRVGALRLTKGEVAINDLERRGEPAVISGLVTGKAADVLKLIDMKPLGYPSRYGLDPASVGGDAAITLGLVVPTLKALKVEDIGFDIKAALRNVAMPIASDISLTDGAAEFVVTGTGLTAEGQGEIAGVTASFAWAENFSPGPGQTSTAFSAAAVIDEALRQRLGVDPGAYLDGAAAVEVSMTGNGFDPVTASARVDLAGAALNVPELGYVKPAGEPALMIAELERVADGYRANPVRLTGTGIDADLDILLGFDGSLRSIRANRLAAGRNDVAFTVDLAGDKPRVTADVKSLDLETLIDALLTPADSELVETAQAAAADSPSEPPHVAMQIKAEKVLMRGGAEATDLVFDIDLDHGNLVGLLLQGRIGTGAMLARLWPQADGRRRVILESDDMGRFVHGLSGYPGIAGGYGKFAVLLPKPGSDAPAPGTASMRDFRLMDQSFLVRVLGAGSFTGMGDLIDGNGLLFDNLTADLSLTEHRIGVTRLRVTGPSAGITAEAFIDRDANTVNAVGVFTPVYSLNTLLRCIPLVGEALGGDEGLLAVAFAVRGDIEDPEISVNAFSALAPGILRRLFEYDLPGG